MSRDVDFTVPNLNNLKKILRPSSNTLQKTIPKSQEAKKQPNTQNLSKLKPNFAIQKSFDPPTSSEINKAIHSQVQQLKQYAKSKILKQKLKKKLIAEGEISRFPQSKPTQIIKDNIRIDQSGRIRDQDGNLIFVQNKATDLKINQKKEQQKDIRQMGNKQRIKYHMRLGRGFFDRNLFLGSKSKRQKKMMLGLQFLEKGSYKAITLGNTQNKPIQSLSQALEEDHQLKTKIIKKRATVKLITRRDAPDVQWWDIPLLKQSQYPDFSNDLQIQQYTNLNALTEPIAFQRVGSEKMQQKITIPMYLTKDEKKKLKRKRKQQKLQQKNDKVKLGLIKPEKPKLTISNMAVVLKDEFIMDPSRVENLARQETQQRLNKHLESNSSRKLSKKKRQQKSIRKLKRDSARQCRRVLFKVDSLDDPSHIFKINMNAKQLALNGMVIKPSNYHRQPVLIAIQGGIKAVKFYKNLMMTRIHWTDCENRCALVWEGKIDNTTLGKWKNYQVSDQPETIRILTQKGIQSYWQYFLNA